MNTILRKCLEALEKDSPDISYVRGMIETLMEMQGTPLPPSNTLNVPIERRQTISTPVGLVDEADAEEASLAARYSGGPIGRLTS